MLLSSRSLTFLCGDVCTWPRVRTRGREGGCEFSLVSRLQSSSIASHSAERAYGRPAALRLPPTPLFESRRSSNLRRRAFVGGEKERREALLRIIFATENGLGLERRDSLDACNFSFSSSFSVRNSRKFVSFFFSFFLLEKKK